jgi:type II secretory pathway pseudopilin PulG
MKNTRKGFITQLLLIIIALLLVGIGVYLYMQKNQASSTAENVNQLMQQALSSARAKGSDAAIESNFSDIQTQAELYYSESGNNSYTGVCTSSEIANDLASIQTENGGTAPTCNSSAKAYAVVSPLATDNTKFWCVDSADNFGKTTTPLGANTVCPTLSTTTPGS